MIYIKLSAEQLKKNKRQMTNEMESIRNKIYMCREDDRIAKGNELQIKQDQKVEAINEVYVASIMASMYVIFIESTRRRQ